MYITAININNINNHSYNTGAFLKRSCVSFPSCPDGKDVFIKSVSFGSKTSAGIPLKKLADITCPYSGVKMLQGSLLMNIEKNLDKCDTISKSVKMLSKYTRYMQKTEKKMFKRFSKYAELNPDKTIPDYLKEVYNKSLAKLKLEEFSVFDDIDRISKDLSPGTALSLREKTARCRSLISENNEEIPFKRKSFLNSLEEIVPNKGEEEIFEKIKARAVCLPTSGCSENAFVVKYADRTHPEIAKRILRASLATIEHIVPGSLRGPNKLSNFILASSGANSYRENMPLVRYIERFPDIPKNCQKYMDEIISSIHKGKLDGCEAYPYEVKRTLEQESKGRISLDLSKYKYTHEEAQLKAEDYKRRGKNSKKSI